MSVRARVMVASIISALMLFTSLPVNASGGSGGSSGPGSGGSSGPGSGPTRTTVDDRHKDEPGEVSTTAPTVTVPVPSVTSATSPPTTALSPASTVGSTSGPVTTQRPTSPNPTSPNPTSSAPSLPAPSSASTSPSEPTLPGQSGGTGTTAPSSTSTTQTTQGSPTTYFPTVSTRPEKTQRLSKSASCGKISLSLEVASDARSLRVRTSIRPKSSSVWMATVLQDRRITWRGRVQRGELDRLLTNLKGSEVVAVRLTDANGIVCAAELIVPS